MSLGDLLDNQERKPGTAAMPGVVVGIVTENKDEEKMGRIKVTFPWRADESKSYWIRMSVPMAGKNRGTWFLPEIGDEVLVAFDRGDVDKPFVIGALWNGKDNPPEVNADGKNNIRKIRSRSGHELIFDDNKEQKKEKIIIHTNSGHKIILDDTDGKGQIHVETKKGHKVTLDDTNGKEKISVIDKTGSNKMIIDSVKKSIDIECSNQMQLKAQTINIDGTTAVNIKSMKIDINGTSKVDIKAAQLSSNGSAMASHEAGGIMTIKGALVKIN